MHPCVRRISTLYSQRVGIIALQGSPFRLSQGNLSPKTRHVVIRKARKYVLVSPLSSLNPFEDLSDGALPLFR